MVSGVSYSAFVTTLRTYNPDYLFTAYNIDAGTNYMDSTGASTGQMMLTNGMAYNGGALPWIRGGNSKTANGITGAANGSDGFTVLWAGRKKASPTTGGSYLCAENPEAGETGIGNQTSFKWRVSLAYTPSNFLSVASTATVTNGEFCALIMTYSKSDKSITGYKNGVFDMQSVNNSFSNAPVITGQWKIGKRATGYTDLSTVSAAIWGRILASNEIADVSNYINATYGGETL